MAAVLSSSGGSVLLHHLSRKTILRGGIRPATRLPTTTRMTAAVAAADAIISYPISRQWRNNHSSSSCCCCGGGIFTRNRHDSSSSRSRRLLLATAPSWTATSTVRTITTAPLLLLRGRQRGRRQLWHFPSNSPDNNNNNNNNNNDSSDPTTTTTGLFSIPELQEPDDFAVLAKQAMSNCNQFRTSVAQTVSVGLTVNSSNSNTGAIRLLHQLDDISNEICNVIDAAELCRNVHVDDKWRDAANQAFAVLADYMTILNSDTSLYHALQLVLKTATSEMERCSNSNDPRIQISDEDWRFTELLKAEFERDGIHLSDSKREEVRVIQNSITQLESSFNENLVHSRHLFTVDQADSVTDVIRYSVLQQLGAIQQQTSTGTRTTSEQIQLKLNNNDTQILQTLLKYSDDPNLRRQIFMEYMTSIPENLSVIEEIRKARHSLAQLQGFDSFAARNLVDKMAKTPDNVHKFLQTAFVQNKNAFQLDMEKLSNAKQKVEGDSNLQPWDILFYTGLVKSQYEGNDWQSSISQYLTLHNTLESMQILVDRLFGIQMVEKSMSDKERWDVVSTCDDDDNLQQPPPEVADDMYQQQPNKLRKFAFTDEEGRFLGTMYLDLHPRPGKYGHAAHFTVRCGCALTTSSGNKNDNIRYQYPIVALVCNLSNNGAHLSHNEVETLFHEFGHALHSLLSRTKFQHVSGTRAAMDFVETPSHLIENFVWDPAFLNILARHHSTGEPLSDERMAQLQRSRHECSALERQNQILYAQFDQTLFGKPTGETSTEIFARLHREHGVLYADGTHWHTRFGHLVSYGAGYYGYLYSQSFAHDIWKHCFENRSLDRTAGNMLWKKMLIHGGAKDPMAILKDLLGREPKVDFSD